MGDADRTGAKRDRRRMIRRAAVAAILLCLVAGTVAAMANPTVRQSIHYSRKPKTGSPEPIATAVAPTAGTALPGAPLRIAVAGDVGTGAAEEWATAAAMDVLEGDVEYRALLLLGDNVYPNGDPSKVGSNVLEPFAGVLDGGTELLPVLGNHDVDSGFGDAQVAALGMPGPWYATDLGDVLVVSLDSNRPNDADQLEWLVATLVAATERWRIVTMHHPPYSGGWHGSDIAVRKAFVPLLEQYGVQLVLAGHDHDYQRSEAINGVTYVVSGGAALLRPAHLAEFSEAAWSRYHFTDITVWPDRLDLRAVDQQLGVIDEISLTP